jgi:predicted acylesterase/phospholipase RssA
MIGNLFLAGLVVSSPAPTDPSRPWWKQGAPVDVVLTISGGVSLGAYESGYLYALNQAVARIPRLRIRVLTGASAGSANALLAGMDSCRPPSRNPTESLGYRTWIPVGVGSLYDKSEVKGTSIFHRKPLQDAMERVWEVWKDGWEEGCEFYLGITATRLEAIAIPLHQNLSVPRQQEKFVLKVVGRGPGVPPRLENYLPSGTKVLQPMLPLVRDDGMLELAKKNFEQLQSAIFASMAFPAAFPPQPIAHCLVPHDETDIWACARPQRTDLFVDGGVFDNNPLGLANTIAESINVAKTIIGRSAESVETDSSGTLFFYLDADLPGYPQPHRAQTSKKTLLGLASSLGDQWIHAARSRELYGFVSTHPDAAKELRVAEGLFPKASEPMGAFFGFFEEDFRIFDFYLGMYDAFDRLQRSSQAMSNDILGELVGAPVTVDADSSRQAFFCLRSWFDPGRESERHTCEQGVPRNLSVLVQTSMERLYNACASKDLAGEIPAAHYHCRRAAEGHAPPTGFPGRQEESPDAWRLRDGESDLAFFLRRLGDLQFHYRNLGLRPDQAQEGAFAVRRSLLAMVDGLGDAQEDVVSGGVIKLGGRQVLNRIAYEPLQHWFYALFGTNIEGGFGFTPFGGFQEWFALTTVLKLSGLSSLVRNGSFGVSLGAGTEFLLVPISGPTLQPALGFRGGYRFASGDGFTTDACEEGDTRNCSRPFVDGYLSLGIVELIRIQLAAEYFLGSGTFDEGRFDIQFGVGAIF